MKKLKSLFKLREWFTISEAAKHLSDIFEEEVGEADVLRLGLDGHLKLSVYFVNHAYARCGKVVSYKDVKWTRLEDTLDKLVNNNPFFKNKSRMGSHIRIKAPTSVSSLEEFPGELLDKESDTFKKYKDYSPYFMTSLNIDNEKYLNLEDDIKTIKGVWDLAMVGGEALDVEHDYQNLTGGPGVTLITMEGAFVVGPEGEMCQLQESYDGNEFTSGSKAQLKGIEEYIISNNIKKKKADELLANHKKNREKYLAKRSERKRSDDYYPAGGLPKDSVLVVRTQALIDLQNMINNSGENVKKTLDERAERTYLNIIGALLECITGTFKDKTFSSETQLRDFIDQKFDDLHGLRSRTLAEKFALAKKALNNEL